MVAMPGAQIAGDQNRLASISGARSPSVAMAGVLRALGTAGPRSLDSIWGAAMSDAPMLLASVSTVAIQGAPRMAAPACGVPMRRALTWGAPMPGARGAGVGILGSPRREAARTGGVGSTPGAATPGAA